MSKGLPEWCQTHSFKEFLELMEDADGCKYCKRGMKPVKMKRQYVHYLHNRKIVVCTDQGYKPSESKSSI